MQSRYRDINGRPLESGVYLHAGTTPILIKVRGDGALDYSVQNFIPLNVHNSSRLLSPLDEDQVKERLESRRDFKMWLKSLSEGLLPNGPSRDLVFLARGILNGTKLT